MKPFEIGAYDDKLIPGLKKFAEAAHAGGGKAVMQLHHGGKERAYRLKKGETIGPSAVPNLVYRQKPREMARADIQEIIAFFGTAVVGMKPREDLKSKLKEKAIPHVVDGDAVQVRRIMEATEEGVRAAWEL